MKAMVLQNSDPNHGMGTQDAAIKSEQQHKCKKEKGGKKENTRAWTMYLPEKICAQVMSDVFSDSCPVCIELQINPNVLRYQMRWQLILVGYSVVCALPHITHTSCKDNRP